jgi:hypothetical protein
MARLFVEAAPGRVVEHRGQGYLYVSVSDEAGRGVEGLDYEGAFTVVGFGVELNAVQEQGAGF